MTKNLLRAGALSCALLASTCLTLPAMAQQMTLTAPPVRQTVDNNGVDLGTGTISMPKASLTIGAGEGALSYEATIQNGRSHVNLYGWITRSGSTYTVSLGGASEVFTLSGSTFTPVEARGSSLAFSGARYVYTAADGTVATFENEGDPGFTKVSNSPASGRPMLVEVVRPNGERLNYVHYTQVVQTGVTGCCTPILATGRRLTAVVSNFGYQIRFDYARDDAPTLDAAEAWATVTRVRAINNAVEPCVPAPAACTTAHAWPSLDIAWDSATNTAIYTDSLQQQTRFTYTGGTTQNLISAVRLPGSASDDITIQYDAANRVSSVTRHGVTTAYGYQDNGGIRTVTVSRAGAAPRVLTFDIARNVVLSDRNEVNQTTSYDYDASNRLKRIVRPAGDSVLLDYDTRGNLIESRLREKGQNPDFDIVTSADYPDFCVNAVTCNLPISTTDAARNTTEYTYYEGHGGLRTVTGPAPAPNAPRPQTRYEYEQLQATYYGGGGTLITGPAVTLLKFTSVCRTSAACAGTADETRTTLTRSATINLLPTSVATGAGDDSLVATQIIGYDNVRNRVSLDGPLAGTDDKVHFRYDALRRNVGTISPDPDGAGALRHRAQRVTYRGDGQVHRVETGTDGSPSDPGWSSFVPNGGRRESDFDAHGRPIGDRLIQGSTTIAMTRTSYDQLGRPECSAVRMDPGAAAALSADACQDSTSGSGEPDRITRTIRDAADRVTEIRTAVDTDIEAAEVRYDYTANGNVAWAMDARGNRTTYGYDGHGRRVRTFYPVAAAGAEQSSATDYDEIGYDAAGRIDFFRNRAGETTSFRYDALGRRTAVDRPGSEPDLAFTYNLMGQTLSASQGAQALGFTYDALGRQLTQSGPHGTIASEYDLAGRRTKITHPGGYFVEQDYLVTGEMRAIRENGATSGVGVIAVFGYDDRGRRTSLTRGNGVTTHYQWDDASQLDVLAHSFPNAANDLTLAFDRNAASQITATRRSNDIHSFAPAAGAEARSHDGLNRIASEPAQPVSYDARGNLTAEGGRTFGYSSDNRLTSMTGGGRSYGFSYDAVGRLQEVTTSNLAARSYAWDGNDAIVTYQGGNFLLRTVYGPGENEPLYQLDSQGRRTWFVQDERGSTIAGSDASGAAAGQQGYDAYGEGNSSAYAHGFTGALRLRTTGLYYMRARIYDPKLGRFLQPDPIGYDDGMNMYAYTGGDPVNWTDPSGTHTIPNPDDMQCYASRITGCSLDQVTAEGWGQLGPLNLGTGHGVGWGATQVTGTFVRVGPTVAHSGPSITVTASHVWVPDIEFSLESYSRSNVGSLSLFELVPLEQQSCSGSGIDTWIGAGREVGEATADLGNIGLIAGAAISPLNPPVGGTIMRGSQAVVLLGEGTQGLANVAEVIHNGNVGPLASQMSGMAAGAGAMRAFDWYRRIPVRGANGRFARNPLTRFQAAYRRVAQLAGSKAGSACPGG
jgi:RHS repeat-associated protein